MTHLLTFTAGLATGIALVLYLIGRPIGRPLQVRVEEEWRVPVDPYTTGLGRA